MQQKPSIHVGRTSRGATDGRAADARPARSIIRGSRYLGAIRYNDPRVRVRLFTIPHAGGGTSVFRKWTDAVPTSVEIIPVQLPGREARIADQPFVRLAPLLSELAEAMVPHLGVPFALFGHSMGALICFELARYLRRAFGASPVHLFLSAAPAPQMQRRHRAMHDLPTEELLEELRRLDGTPNEVLRSDEVMHLLLPALRADLTLIETYSYFPDAPLACPISVFGGLNDARVTPAEIAAWREHGSGPFTQRMVPGGHFFAYDPRGPVAESIISELVRVAGVIP
jgi:medium-chain acyl-[acyl-carrier-protein] hydrolase